MKKIARQKKIILFGSGNVAWHLAKHLNSLGKFSITVYNHRSSPQLDAFRTLNCSIETAYDKIITDADFYIIAVSDSNIEELSAKIKITNPNAVLMHTAGSIKLKALGKRIHGTAVFYPLQSFSKNDSIDWQEIPLILETSDEQTSEQVRSFAKKFSRQLYFLNYSDRLKVHLAAVIVNNFTNALFAAAEGLLSETSLTQSLKILQPLINKTNAKLTVMSPIEAQTGPAKRNDKVVMKKHLQVLKHNTELRKVYKLMSALIAQQQEK